LALDKVEQAASTDDTRPLLNSVLIEPTKEEGFIRAVASDGVRLLTCKIPGVLPKEVLIPRNVVSLLTKALSGKGDCGVFADDSFLTVKLEDGLFQTRLLAKEFPNFNKLLSRGSSVHIVVNKDETVNALKRALLFSEASDRIITTFHQEGKMSLTCHNAEGDAQEEVDLMSSVEKITEPLKMCFNGKILQQVLEKFDGDSVSLNVFSANAPVVLTGDPNMLGLIQPMNL
jgi:DNA polymerase III sliding clamp (beta) subunit (PCNA family)